MSTEPAEPESAAASATATEDPFYANAYAISFRLLGDRALAGGVATEVADDLHRAGGLGSPTWMRRLVTETVRRCGDVDPGDGSGIRAALRRRLASASTDECVAGSLVHLAGYPVDFVAEVIGTDAPTAASLAGVIAPPPEVDYRELGDPALLHGGRSVGQSTRARFPRPHWTTVVAVTAVLAFILAATQCHGERPVLGDPIEGAASTEVVVLQRNGGPLTQLTNE